MLPNSKLKPLLAEADVIKSRINDVRAQEADAAKQAVKELVVNYDLKPSDLFPGLVEKRAKPAKLFPAEPKYCDPSTGKTWTGRGKMPYWLKAGLAQGLDRNVYAISPH